MLCGFVNHIFWNGLVPTLGRERALLWPLKLKVIPVNYHGETFEGNPCRKMLKNADLLLDPEILQGTSPLDIMKYVSALKGMNKVVENCFSTRKVSTETEKHLIELRALFEGTDLSETLKVHVILEHVKDCLATLKDGRGLGIWSEQSGESIHREFLEYWSRYKINLLSDPKYGDRLIKAVIKFSSRHI